jgi:hypothetical protein
MSSIKKNVLGTDLKLCCSSPVTGFYRDGYCSTGPTDYGTHVVCATVTKDFLEFTKTKGNDLSTPLPEYNFKGLVPGDKWCLCASRWMQAYKAGKAPLIDLEASDEKLLQYTNIETLKKFDVNKD